MLLNQIDNFHSTISSRALSLPFATEASWVTGKWDKLEDYVRRSPAAAADFNVGVGHLLLALNNSEAKLFLQKLNRLRMATAQGLSLTNTASLQECHELMLRFHVLAEIEAISGTSSVDAVEKPDLFSPLNQRLEVLGPFVTDKQYILGLRRATMQLSKYV